MNSALNVSYNIRMVISFWKFNFIFCQQCLFPQYYFLLFHNSLKSNTLLKCHMNVILNFYQVLIIQFKFKYYLKRKTQERQNPGLQRASHLLGRARRQEKVRLQITKILGRVHIRPPKEHKSWGGSGLGGCVTGLTAPELCIHRKMGRTVADRKMMMVKCGGRAF